MTLYGAPFADPLRPWETDVQPVIAHIRHDPVWEPCPSCTNGDRRCRLCGEHEPDDAAGTAYLTAAIAAVLVAVLVVIGIRRFA